MAKRQTRRSISVRGTTYDALRAFAEDNQRSMSDIVEELLGGLLAPGGRKTVAPRVLKASPRPERGSAGRPAPTPAESVIPRRSEAPRGDYRMIRF
jgi:hypothetical protein